MKKYSEKLSHKFRVQRVESGSGEANTGWRRFEMLVVLLLSCCKVPGTSEGILRSFEEFLFRKKGFLGGLNSQLP